MRARDLTTGRFVKVDPQPLTASVAVLPTESIEKMPRNAEGWQERAWRLWRILGVLHFPTSFKAKQVARLKWNVQVDGKDLEPEAAEKAVQAVTGPLTVREASRRIALNYEIAGEVFYARAKDEWNVYASTTPKLKELLKAADIVVRAWESDPEQPQKPSSSIQAALGTAEQIRLMCALSRGQDRNRLAQRGILLVPKEGQFPEGDDFQANLETSMTAPLADEYSPSAVVPLKVEFPAEYIEKWRHLVLESPYDDKLMDRIDATIRQLALEMDMPPEMLLGNMDSNHWNAWLSSEENYRAHVEPLGVATGEVYAEAMMQAVDGSVSILVTPDASELLARRSSVEDAFQALTLGVVGFEYVRRQIGADEEDAPTPDEIALILQLTGKVAAPIIDAPAMNGNGNKPVTAAVDPDLEALGRQLTDIDIKLLSHLQGLAAMAVDHIRQVVSEDQVGAQHQVAEEMERLGKAWNREVTKARKALRELGIDSRGLKWDEAQKRSVELLTDEMTTFVTENLGKTDSEMPALPVLVLRRVLAAAGGSR